MSKTITPEMIEALAHLREFATRVKEERFADKVSKDAALAVDLLDNEDFFALIDDEANNTFVGNV